MPMRSCWWVGSLGVAVVAIGASIAACSTVPDTNYGNPAGLSRTRLAGDGGVEALICVGIGAGDGGGAAGAEAGACAISWAKDIFPKMKADGPWHCADAKCHGGVQPPVMNVTTPALAYDSLKDWKIPGSPNAYIQRGATAGVGGDAGAGDPTKSTIECNLMSQCGQGMPQSPGKAPTHDEMCEIHAWLLCGAPNN